MKIRLFLFVSVALLFTASTVNAVPSNRHLPIMAGEKWWCSQGWNVPPTHQGEKAWDFNWGSGSDDLGKPILAPCSGTIEFAGNTNGPFGIVILIKYSDGTYDRIAHCNAVAVKRGEAVKQGQVIAWCGGSGGWPSHIHNNAQSTNQPGVNGVSLVSNFYYRQGTTDYYGCPQVVTVKEVHQVLIFTLPATPASSLSNLMPTAVILNLAHSRMLRQKIPPVFIGITLTIGTTSTVRAISLIIATFRIGAEDRIVIVVLSMML